MVVIPAHQEGEGNLRVWSLPKGAFFLFSSLTQSTAPEFLRFLQSKRAAVGSPSVMMRLAAPPRSALTARDLDSSFFQLANPVPAGGKFEFCFSTFEFRADGQANTPARYDCHLPQGTATCF